VARTSKSPRVVPLAALVTAKQALPPYSHRHSPKKFTQHQLFACLVLKGSLKTDYRGVVAHLADCTSLVEVLGLTTVPHYKGSTASAGQAIRSGRRCTTGPSLAPGAVFSASAPRKPSG
jgi:hypothetical protein